MVRLSVVVLSVVAQCVSALPASDVGATPSGPGSVGPVAAQPTLDIPTSKTLRRSDIGSNLPDDIPAFPARSPPPSPLSPTPKDTQQIANTASATKAKKLDLKAKPNGKGLIDADEEPQTEEMSQLASVTSIRNDSVDVAENVTDTDMDIESADSAAATTSMADPNVTETEDNNSTEILLTNDSNIVEEPEVEDDDASTVNVTGEDHEDTAVLGFPVQGSATGSATKVRVVEAEQKHVQSQAHNESIEVLEDEQDASTPDSGEDTGFAGIPTDGHEGSAAGSSLVNEVLGVPAIKNVATAATGSAAGIGAATKKGKGKKQKASVSPFPETSESASGEGASAGSAEASNDDFEEQDSLTKVNELTEAAGSAVEGSAVGSAVGGFDAQQQQVDEDDASLPKPGLVVESSTGSAVGSAVAGFSDQQQANEKSEPGSAAGSAVGSAAESAAGFATVANEPIVGGCQGTQFGCCDDSITGKEDEAGSNCGEDEVVGGKTAEEMDGAAALAAAVEEAMLSGQTVLGTGSAAAATGSLEGSSTKSAAQGFDAQQVDEDSESMSGSAGSAVESVTGSAAGSAVKGFDAQQAGMDSEPMPPAPSVTGSAVESITESAAGSASASHDGFGSPSAAVEDFDAQHADDSSEPMPPVPSVGGVPPASAPSSVSSGGGSSHAGFMQEEQDATGESGSDDEYQPVVTLPDGNGSSSKADADVASEGTSAGAEAALSEADAAADGIGASKEGADDDFLKDNFPSASDGASFDAGALKEPVRVSTSEPDNSPSYDINGRPKPGKATDSSSSSESDSSELESGADAPLGLEPISSSPSEAPADSTSKEEDQGDMIGAGSKHTDSTMQSHQSNSGEQPSDMGASDSSKVADESSDDQSSSADASTAADKSSEEGQSSSADASPAADKSSEEGQSSSADASTAADKSSEESSEESSETSSKESSEASSEEGQSSSEGSATKDAPTRKWGMLNSIGAADSSSDDLSDGGGETSLQEGKSDTQCQQAAPCELLHGKGKIHCSQNGEGACRAQQCDDGYQVDTETSQCTVLCRPLPMHSDPCDTSIGVKGSWKCDKDTGDFKCLPDVDKSSTPVSAQPSESGGFWGLLGMLMIGGVVGGMFYMKGYLPPQVQAYLGGTITKTHGGSEYEMVAMQNRDESLGVTDAPIDARMASHRAEEEEASMEMTTFAQEDPEDWGDDDGWGDDDDGWGDKWSENDDAPKVRPTSADEARQNARFNNNR